MVCRSSLTPEKSYGSSSAMICQYKIAFLKARMKKKTNKKPIVRPTEIEGTKEEEKIYFL